MEKLIFEYKGIVLSEPNMLLTNWLITIVCIWCLIKLKNRQASALLHYYRMVFIMNGTGAFFGGLAHLFFHYTGKPFQAFAWIFIGLGTYYLQRSSLLFEKNTKLRRYFLNFSITKLILFLALLFYFQSFFVVLADLALGLFVIVVPTHVKHYQKTKNKGSMLILTAVGILLVSAIFPIFKISIHEAWFNFNDIGHVFLAISLYIIFLSFHNLAVTPTDLEK